MCLSKSLVVDGYPKIGFILYYCQSINPISQIRFPLSSGYSGIRIARYHQICKSTVSG